MKSQNTDVLFYISFKTVNEYDQEIPKSHTADKPTPPHGRATVHKQPQDTGKTIKVNSQLSLPYQYNSKARKDTHDHNIKQGPKLEPTTIGATINNASTATEPTMPLNGH